MRKPITNVNGDPRSICDRLIAMRNSKKMTLAHVAERFKVNKSTAMRWETRQYWSEIDTPTKRLLLMQLAELYQSNSDWMLSGSKLNISELNNVMIIDDDNTSLSIMTLMIKSFFSSAYRIISFHKPAESFEWAISNSSNFVFCDYRMPEIFGDELVLRLRDLPAYQSTPIIAVTQVHEGNVKERMLAAGANTVLQKPISAHDLQEIMAAYLL